MKKIILSILVLVGLNASAQTIFLDKGKIIYERRMTQFALQESVAGNDDEFLKSPFYEEIKKAYPKVTVDQFTLAFDATQSIFRFGEDNGTNKYINWQFKPSDEEYIYQNIQTQEAISEINLFEKKYKIKEPLPAYKWKLTGETREIAGFECKKAITTMADSIVVVAFYTDEITSSVGPMGFHGLPGAILGLAIPRLYLNLFATRVERAEAIFKPPYKASDKFVTRSVMYADVDKISDIQTKWKPLYKWSLMIK